jgi:hypothetical protein
VAVAVLMVVRAQPLEQHHAVVQQVQLHRVAATQVQILAAAVAAVET